MDSQLTRFIAEAKGQRVLVVDKVRSLTLGATGGEFQSHAAPSLRYSGILSEIRVETVRRPKKGWLNRCRTVLFALSRGRWFPPFMYPPQCYVEVYLSDIVYPSGSDRRVDESAFDEHGRVHLSALLNRGPEIEERGGIFTFSASSAYSAIHMLFPFTGFSVVLV